MNLGMWEIVTLSVLALLIFGPERLPEIARTVGRTVAQFRREASSTLEELKRSADLEGLRESADLSELRGLADDVRAQTRDLKQAVSVSGAAAATAPRDPGAPPPFDPDAT